MEGSSYGNVVEAAIVASIVAKALSAPGFQGGSGAGGALTVGVIAPYATQVAAIKKALGPALSEGLQATLEISTVDGFQGRERDLIVFSATRANASGAVGFVADWRRLNVTLTRARNGLIVVGNAPTLRQELNCWKGWLEWVKQSAFVVEATATASGAEQAGAGGYSLKPVVGSSSTTTPWQPPAPPPAALAAMTSKSIQGPPLPHPAASDSLIAPVASRVQLEGRGEPEAGHPPSQEGAAAEGTGEDGSNKRSRT